MGWHDYPSTSELGWRAGLVFGLVAIGIGAGFFLAHRPQPHRVSLVLDSGSEVTALVPPGGAHLVAATFAPTGDKLAGEMTHRLLDDGVAVIEIPLDVYGAHLDREAKDDCHYVLGDVEDLSHKLERTLAFPIYRRPVIVGVGAGGAYAYGALAQSPPNTVAGAVLVGFDPAIGTVRPFCPETKSVARADGRFDIAAGFVPSEDEPARTALVAPLAAFTRTPDPVLTAITEGAHADPPVVVTSTGVREAAIAALDMANAAATADGTVPVDIIDPACKTDTMAVILSGDGGWRDLDKTIGERLAARGIGVVGVDSLAYFWSRKDPPQIGKDLGSLIARYQTTWKAKHVLLIGYSFGADVLPASWTHIPEAIRQAIDLVALLGFSPRADYEISIGAYLGTSSGDADTVAAAADLPPDRVVCIAGEEEGADSACSAPVFDKAERITTPGGHHFDGDYAALADRIVAAFTRRSGDALPATCP